jgi:hypothetical protein
MGILDTGPRPPSANYRGHTFLARVDQDNGLNAQAVAECQACGLKVSAETAMYGALEPCPETAEGKALLAQAEALAAQPAKLSGPAIAVPEGWTGTDAEAVGLAVAGAVGGVIKERDEAKAMAEEAVTTLGQLLSVWPETSWASSESEKAAAMEVHKRLATALWGPEATKTEPGPKT